MKQPGLNRTGRHSIGKFAAGMSTALALFLFSAVPSIILFSAVPSLAVNPDEVLPDPVLESRARAISSEVRCLVCQNESIDSSNAELAKDLRLIVRERLVAGDSDQQVFDYLVARYGDFVLLRPPVRPETYVLWFGPAVVFVLGVVVVGFYFTRQKRRFAADTPLPLSARERQRLEQLLADAPQDEMTQRPSSSSDQATGRTGTGKPKS